MSHTLQPIGAHPLHPNEVLLVAAATARGLYCGRCICGVIVTGVNDLDLFCNFKSHRTAVAR